MSKIYRREPLMPVLKTFFQNTPAASIGGSIKQDKPGYNVTYVLKIVHPMRQGYLGRGVKVNRYGRERLGSLTIVGRKFQAEQFDKSTADRWANRLMADGCHVTIEPNYIKIAA